ncbi:hypothetical protein EGW08_003334, partial [Elysia chlorotica]
MGQKEDKKDKSKGLVYVTNGDSKRPGLPDPEMTPSDDVSSEGLPQKKSRRCGRYRCPIISVCVVIGVAAVACAVYFSVTILMEDDEKSVNETLNKEAGQGGPSPHLGMKENVAEVSVTVPMSTTVEPVDLANMNAGSLVRGLPSRPGGSALRALPTR